MLLEIYVLGRIFFFFSFILSGDFFSLIFISLSNLISSDFKYLINLLIFSNILISLSITKGSVLNSKFLKLIIAL